MLDDSSTKRGIVLFQYNKRSRCSDIGEMHRRLPPVPIPAIPSPQIMGNPPIGAGTAFLGEEHSHDNLIIEPVKDSLEAERRNRMVKAVAKYTGKGAGAQLNKQPSVDPPSVPVWTLPVVLH